MSIKTKKSASKMFQLDPDEFAPHNVKIRVTTMIDMDVVNDLKAIAGAKRMKYQTLMNRVLRSFVENSTGKKIKPVTEAQVKKLIRQELRKRA